MDRSECPRGAECKGRDCPDCANFSPPPAEQASGEAWTCELIFAGYQPNGYKLLRNGEMVARIDTHDEADDEQLAHRIVAALSQRPVVGDVRILARDVHYAIADYGLAPARPADNVAMREAILRVLTLAPQQPEKGEG